MTRNQWYAIIPIALYLLSYAVMVAQAALKVSQERGHDPQASAQAASGIIQENHAVRLHHTLVILMNSLVFVVVGYILARIR